MKYFFSYVPPILYGPELSGISLADWRWRLWLLPGLLVTLSSQAQSVTSRTPARNALAVSAGTTVAQTYSSLVTATRAQNIRILSNQYRGRRTATVSVTSSTATLTPTAPAGASAAFRPGEVVSVSIPATVSTAAKQVYQFTVAAGAGPGTLLSSSTTAVGTSPFDVATGDVDGDGDLDLLTANYDARTVSVRFNNGSGSFTGASEVSVGAGPDNVVLGDVDGDGDLDMLAANGDDATVSVRFNTGNGTFGGGSEVSAESGSGSVALGDVDADGDLDLVTANTNTNTASIRFNNGAGAFSGTGNVAVGISPSGVTLGDVDSDGDLDLLATNIYGNTVSVRLNNGSGTFSGTTDVAVGSNPHAVALGDVDGDGDLDLLVTNVDDNTVSVRLNSGTGTFTGTTNIGVGSSPYTMVLGDIDGDGDLDLLTANLDDNTLSVRRNNGSGIFSGTINSALGVYPHGLALGDVDGDGDLDLLAASPTASTISVLLNKVAAPVLTSLSPTSGAVGSSVTLTGTTLAGATSVSFNGTLVTSGFTVSADGTTLTVAVPAGATTGNVAVTTAAGTSNGLAFTVLPTLVSTAPTRNALAVNRLTNVALTFSSNISAAQAAALRVHSMQAGGQQATTASSSGNTATLHPTVAFKPGEVVSVTVPATVVAPASKRVYQFTTAVVKSTGTFGGGSEVVVGTNPRSVAVGDVDGDGDLDMLTANDIGNNVSVRLNDGAGTYSGNTSVSVGNYPSSITLGDVDGDGDLDLLTANANANTVSVRFNSGAGIYSGTTEVAVGSSPYSVTLGDVDADGDLDLLTANDVNSGTVSIRLNDGTGTFASGTEVSTGAAPSSVALGDVDSDGDLDLVTANYSAKTASVRLNNGDGTFAGTTSVTTGTAPISITLGDVDADGDLDILTANANANTVSVRLNNGAGTFTGTAEVAVGSSPYSVALSDVDGDGDLDLLVANRGNSSVSVRLNNGSGTFAGGSEVSAGTNANGIALGDVDGDGDLDMLVANRGSNTVSVRLNSVPVLTAISPTSGIGGQALTLSGMLLDGATQVTFANTSGGATTSPVANFTSINYTTTPQTIVLPVPASLAAGTYAVTVTTPNGTSNALILKVAAVAQDLVVSTVQTLNGGTYRNVTITGPTTGGAGTLTLTANLTVTGTLTVQNGGALNTGTAAIVGSGSFILADGGQLLVADPAGISSSGASGAIQTTGSRAFSTDATYSYGGSQALVGVTGSGLPTRVRSLLVNTSASGTALALSQGVAISQVLQVASTTAPGSVLTTNSLPLTLLSSAQGTALANLAQNGQVSGTVTVQRYIDPTLNAGAGYRHYSSPVQAQPFAGLATAGFTPELSQASGYNSSATPGTTLPFPTVFDFDESRIPSTTANLSDFSKGWHAPTQATLEVGRGYTVQIPASEKVSFTGTLNVAAQSLPLSYTASSEAGWHLLGNPYAAPLDWSTVSLPTGLNAAMYVFQSTGSYTGQYRSYANGLGGSPLIPSGQGFFVRASAPVTLALSYQNCVLDYATAGSQTFQRTASDTRPRVRLTLQNVGTLADDLYVYVEAGATTGLDTRYDAQKLPNTTGLNLAATASTGQSLAIQGLPALGNQAIVVPLTVQVPQAGRYSLVVGELINFDASTVLTLRDQLLGTSMALTDTTRYAFQTTSITTKDRFYLELRPQHALATTTAQVLAQQVQLYPNPTRGQATLQVPVAMKDAGFVRILNTLGQAVHTMIIAAGQRELTLDVAMLTQGVYQVQVPTTAGIVIRRLVVE